MLRPARGVKHHYFVVFANGLEMKGHDDMRSFLENKQEKQYWATRQADVGIIIHYWYCFDGNAHAPLSSIFRRKAWWATS